jgi:FixJ family two-component response regulator
MMNIVDDDDSVRKNLARLMRSADFAAQAFGSAEAFLASADTRDPGCLLLDITLPGLSGLQLQAELNTRNPSLPVIVISARDDSDTRSLARQLGARYFFGKPVDDQALIDAIQWVQAPASPPGPSGRAAEPKSHFPFQRPAEV